MALEGRVPKTLQIASFGVNPKNILAGIRSFPVHKLILVCAEEKRSLAERVASDIREGLGIPVDIHVVGGNLMEGVLAAIFDILRENKGKFEDVIINAGGNGHSTCLTCCAMISAAFISGLKAFFTSDLEVKMLPVLKLTYKETVSKPKLDILRTLKKGGGEVESLSRLSELSGYGKPLISYHINGSENTRGLLQLGLVEKEKGRRGGTRMRLTTLGRILLATT
jgi:DNA-binding transcriptional ArsR family regulator